MPFEYSFLLTFENERRLEEQKGRGCRGTGLDRLEGGGEARPQGGTLLSQPLQPGWAQPGALKWGQQEQRHSQEMTPI